MSIVLTATAGLCIWIILWGLSISGLDALFPAIGMVMIAIGIRSLLPRFTGRRD